MLTRFIAVGLLLSGSLLLTAQEKKKWDVNNPEGIPYQEFAFSVTEGTWLNVDVSPDGSIIAFDLLGDIYTIPAKGGTATCIRSGIAWEVQPRFSPDGSKILFTSDAGGGDNIWVMDASGENARQVTKENFRLLNNAVWLPDGEYIVARKHFTSGRSLGAGEMWLYHISGGDGLQLTKRKNDQQDVNEPSVSPDGRYVYFSEDMYPGGFFQYNKNAMAQISVVQRYDRQEGKVEMVTGGSGGAARPQISPDGKWLAFVRRVDTKSVLFLHELGTGFEYPVFDGLDKDQQEAWTVFGVYPGFSWFPHAEKQGSNYSIAIWAGGKINRLDVDLGKIAEGKPSLKVADIPFQCDVKTKLAETLRFENKVFEPEFTAKAIRGAATSPDGKSLAFCAAGRLYLKPLPDGTPIELSLSDPVFKNAIAAEPAFSTDGAQMVYVVWDDDAGSRMVLRNMATGSGVLLEPAGRVMYRTPQFSADGKSLVFRVDDGDDEFGPAGTEKPGIYISDARKGAKANFVTAEGQYPSFSPDGKRIYLSSGGGGNKLFISVDLNGLDRREHFKSKYTTQWALSHDGKWMAYTDLFKAYVCAVPQTGQALDLGADTKSIPVSKVASDAGYYLHWSGDDTQLHYTLGDDYYSIDLQQRFTFLPGAPDSLPDLPKNGQKIGLMLKADQPQQTVVFKNARIITCEGDEVIENGTIEVTGNKIKLGRAQ
ncbi:MAG: PD40 domain-containing protein [Lewinellaceae bacterium]|nr:PD40 domain-containing protein [Lewinellaceae bacterium]